MRTERGATLVLSLIILLVMSIIGLSASRIVVLDSKMAINQYDAHHAFWAADFTLSQVEQALKAVSALDLPSVKAASTFSGSSVDAIVSFEPSAAQTFWSAKDDAWWQSSKFSSAFQTTATKASAAYTFTKNNSATGTAAGQYVVERFPLMTTGLGVGTSNTPSGRILYRITSKGEGMQDGTQSLAQSTYMVLVQ